MKKLFEDDKWYEHLDDVKPDEQDEEMLNAMDAFDKQRMKQKGRTLEYKGQ